MFKRIGNNKVVTAVTSLAMTGAAVAAVVAGTGGTALAAGSCDTSSNYHVWYSSYGSGTKTTPTWTTTTHCADINFGVRETTDKNAVGKVRVCFVGAGYCQSSWKSYNSGTMGDIVVASAVKDGTTYDIQWQWTSGDTLGAAIYA